MPYGEANIWWPVADALRHGAGIRSSDPADKAIELARTSVCDRARARTPPPPRWTASTRASSTSWATSPSCGRSIRRAPARRPPRRWSPTPSGSRPTVPWWSCCPTCTGPTTSCSSWSTRCSTGCRSGSSSCWPPPARRWRSAGTRPTAATTSSSSPSTRSRSDSAEALLCELAGADLGAGLAKELLDRSGGNPFFLEELVTLLSDAGMVGDARPHRPRGPRRPARHPPRPRRRPARRPHRRRAARARRLRGARAPRPDDGDRGDGREAPRHRRRAAGARVARGQGAAGAQRHGRGREVDLPLRPRAGGRLQHAHQGRPGALALRHRDVDGGARGHRP